MESSRATIEAAIKSRRDMIAELTKQQQNGYSYYRFSYVISLLVVTLRRHSKSVLLKDSDRMARIIKSLPYIALSFFLGWWGFPWGFIYTPWSIIENLGGGINSSDLLKGNLYTEIGKLEAMLKDASSIVETEPETRMPEQS
jgi:hypothetical protein